MSATWTLLAAAISFGVTALLGKWMIPFLRKLHFGQTIREEGPQWHMKKQGTPTMGGLMFIAGILAAVLICVPLYYANTFDETMLMKVRLFGGLGMALAYGLIGFMDDYIKVVKKRNLGLTVIQKLVLQFAVAAAYLVTVSLSGGGTTTTIPFVGTVDFGWGYWVLAAVLIVGIVNAVNFTDGIDGLNASVTFFVCIFVMMIAGVLSLFSVSILAVSIAAGCMGFLVWNFNPAKVFMGDTGSLFLGGAVCAVAFALNLPILLLPLGVVYIVEILSVVLQVTYFKLTHGKRLFKMSPIHHHCELCGWSEMKICFVFSVVAALGGLISLLLVLFGV
ncbi:MAG TPA: phospho-N-acetylmuramoyl-pentapeptide-transferase [Candidatus Gallacutalibacter pullistercoris]|nr:phospho-N-acetylmuramoyl-pentapeptide-transferase [Candidatus Gallacutalibacter pullistercoris]